MGKVKEKAGLGREKLVDIRQVESSSSRSAVLSQQFSVLSQQSLVFSLQVRGQQAPWSVYRVLVDCLI